MRKKTKNKLFRIGNTLVIFGMIVSYGWTGQDVTNGVNWAGLVVGVVSIIAGIVCIHISETASSYARTHEYYWLEDEDEKVDY